MKPGATWLRPLKSESWAAIVPLVLFLGGLAVAAGLSDLTELAASRSLARDFSGPVPPAYEVGRTPSVGREAAGENPAGLVPDFEPLGALLLPAGDLALRHESVFVETVRALNGQIPVIGIVKDSAQEEHCQKLLRENGIENRSLHFLYHTLDSMWVRDFGPIFVRRADRTLEVVDACYSGSALPERWRDDESPIVFSHALQLPLESAYLRLQGGNLLTNGDGLLLTSTSVCYENLSRGFGEAEIEAKFEACFGTRRWYRFDPVSGDRAQHVDMMASVLSRNHVVVAQADPEADPANAARLDAAAKALAGMETGAGPLHVSRIPLPPPTAAGFVRSYNNIVLVNDLVLVPTFSGVDPDLEERALALFRRSLPGKCVVPIRCDSLADEGGLLRCVTLGIPRGVDWKRLFRRGER